jgi:hypothetical protein
MVTLVSAGQAQAYHRPEFGNAKENTTYTEGGCGRGSVRSITGAQRTLALQIYTKSKEFARNTGSSVPDRNAPSVVDFVAVKAQAIHGDQQSRTSSSVHIHFKVIRSYESQ